MKYDDLDLIGLVACLFMAVIAIVIVIVVHEEKQKRRKPNIRVPKHTLWERTHKYHGTKQ